VAATAAAVAAAAPLATPGSLFHCPVAFFIFRGAFPGRTPIASANDVADKHLLALINNRLNPDFAAANPDLADKLGTLVGDYASSYSLAALTGGGILGNAQVRFFLHSVTRIGIAAPANPAISFGHNTGSNAATHPYVDGNLTAVSVQEVYNRIASSSSSFPKPRCLNVYITTLGNGLLGFGFNNNVICCDWTTIGHGVNGGSNYLNKPATGRVLTHEIGHVFSLRHTFTFNSQENLADTPPQLLPNTNAAFVQEWVPVGNEMVGDGNDSHFGDGGVAVSSSGTRVAVAVLAEDVTHVSVFDLATVSAWDKVGDTLTDPAQGELFGKAVAVSRAEPGGGEMRIAVAAPNSAVRIYRRAGSAWAPLGSPIPSVADATGSFSVAMSADGNIVVIGAISASEPGNPNSRPGEFSAWIWNGDQWVPRGPAKVGEADSDLSGYSVAVSASGDRVAVGAAGNAAARGHVRVWEWNGGNDWIQVGQDIPGEAAGDNFGWAVSMSADGARVAVGAISNSAGGAGTSIGHVRVFSQPETSGGPWSQVGDDIDGIAANGQSGFSVSLSETGTRVAVGAPGDAAGAVRVYDEPLSGAGTGWRPVGQEISGARAGDKFGSSVSLSADGATLAVGATDSNGASAPAGLDPSDARGQVRVWQFVSPDWVRLGPAIDGEAAGDFCGASVALSGGTVVVGAPGGAGSVRVFDLDSSVQEWAPAGDLRSLTSGATVAALSGDGLRVAVGFPSQNVVRVWRWAGGSFWERLGSDLTDPAAAAGLLGTSVAMSADGQTVVAGAALAPNSNDVTTGKTSVWKWSASDGWQLRGTRIPGEAADDQSGLSVAVSSGGNCVVVGEPFAFAPFPAGAGRARVFLWSDTLEDWELSARFVGNVLGDRFGSAVAVSADGKRVAVGSPWADNSAGEVHVFESSAEGWVRLGGAGLVGDGGARAGSSVALSQDGNRVAYGEPFHNSFAGRVSVFAWNGSEWRQVADDLDGVSLPGSGPSLLGKKGIALAGGETGTILASSSADGRGYVRVDALQTHGAYCNRQRDAWVANNSATGSAPGWTAPAAWTAPTTAPAPPFSAGGALEMFMNFMDYSGDENMLFFTDNQVARMRNYLASQIGLSLFGAGGSPFSLPENTRITASQITRTTALLSFASPSSAPSAGTVTGTVYLSPVASDVADAAAIAAAASLGRVVAVPVPAGADSVVAEGLSVGTQYFVNVLISDDGSVADGPLAYTTGTAALSSFVTTATLIVPLGPTIIAATKLTATTARLSWLPTRTTLSGQSVTYKFFIDTDRDALLLATDGVTPSLGLLHDVTGLSPVTEYWVRVEATDGTQTFLYPATAFSTTVSLAPTPSFSSVAVDTASSAFAVTLTATPNITAPPLPNELVTLDAYKNGVVVAAGVPLPSSGAVAHTFAGLAASTEYAFHLVVRYGMQTATATTYTETVRTADELTTAPNPADTAIIGGPLVASPTVASLTWPLASGGAAPDNITYSVLVDTANPPVTVRGAALVRTTSPPEYTVEELSPSTNYFARVVAHSGVDTLPYSIVAFSTAGPLLANGPLMITAAAPTTVTVSWAPSSGGTRDFASHTVSVTDVWGAVSDTVVAGDATSATVSVSENAHSLVTFFVTDSSGAFSPPLAPPISTVTVPNNSTVEVSAKTSTSLTVGWGPVGSENGEVVTYGVFLGAPHAETPFATTTATMFTLTGLNPDTEYSVTVRARNRHYATGVWSVPLGTAVYRTNIAEFRFFPDDTIVLTRNAATFDLSWSQVIGRIPNPGPSEVTIYRVMRRAEDDANEAFVEVTSVTHPTTSLSQLSLPGAIPGKTYRIVVLATETAAGTTAATTIQSESALFTTPAVPLVLPGSNSSVSVQNAVSRNNFGGYSEIDSFDLVVSPHPTGGNGPLKWRLSLFENSRPSTSGTPPPIVLANGLTGISFQELQPFFEGTRLSRNIPFLLEAFTDVGDAPQLVSYEPFLLGNVKLQFISLYYPPTVISQGSSTSGPTLNVNVYGGTTQTFGWRVFSIPNSLYTGGLLARISADGQNALPNPNVTEIHDFTVEMDALTGGIEADAIAVLPFRISISSPLPTETILSVVAFDDESGPTLPRAAAESSICVVPSGATAASATPPPPIGPSILGSIAATATIGATGDAVGFRALDTAQHAQNALLQRLAPEKLNELTVAFTRRLRERQPNGSPQATATSGTITADGTLVNVRFALTNIDFSVGGVWSRDADIAEGRESSESDTVALVAAFFRNSLAEEGGPSSKFISDVVAALGEFGVTAQSLATRVSFSPSWVPLPAATAEPAPAGTDGSRRILVALAAAALIVTVAFLLAFLLLR
jgi:hypothetical protein